jgi:hypothetical protein
MLAGGAPVVGFLFGTSRGLGGLKGGKASAAKMTREERSEATGEAAKARLVKRLV